MPEKKIRLFPAKSAPDKKVKHPKFHTDEVVCQSGIYKVRHKKHRLPHNVTLLKDQHFPRCAKCDTAVVFELMQTVMDEYESLTFSSQIQLYELPALEDDEPAKDDTPLAG